MFDKKHIVIDIETYDTKPTSIILQIAACEFDINNSGNILSEFVVNVNVDSQPNRSYSQRTLDWWRDQGKEKHDTLLVNAIDLQNALSQLLSWLPQDDKYKIWANSPNFDMSILENALNYDIPWKYYQYLDVRTIKELAKSLNIAIPEPDKTQKHTALYDCHYEAFLISSVISHLKQGYLYG